MISNFAKSCLALAALCILTYASRVQGAVEMELEKTLKPDAAPIDVAVTPDGKSTFVLTENGTVLVYDEQGDLEDTLNVGPHIDSIEIDPSGEKLFAASRQNKTVDIIQLSFIQQINTAGSPYKGPDNAPVAVVVFSDYE